MLPPVIGHEAGFVQVRSAPRTWAPCRGCRGTSPAFRQVPAPRSASAFSSSSSGYPLVGACMVSSARARISRRGFLGGTTWAGRRRENEPQQDTATSATARTHQRGPGSIITIVSTGAPRRMQGRDTRLNIARPARAERSRRQLLEHAYAAQAEQPSRRAPAPVARARALRRTASRQPAAYPHNSGTITSASICTILCRSDASDAGARVEHPVRYRPGRPDQPEGRPSAAPTIQHHPPRPCASISAASFAVEKLVPRLQPVAGGRGLDTVDVVWRSSTPIPSSSPFPRPGPTPARRSARPGQSHHRIDSPQLADTSNNSRHGPSQVDPSRNSSLSNSSPWPRRPAIPITSPAQFAGLDRDQGQHR